MPQNPTILAIDAGTSALKAVLYDERGRVLAVTRSQYDYQTPQPGWAEGNPEDWWAALGTALTDLRDNNFEMGNIKAIGLTGQMHTPILLDKAGDVLPPTILWLDRRAVPETAELNRDLGLPPNQLNSTYTLPKLLWLARHQPDVTANIQTILWPKDYLRYRLTGKRFTDATEAYGAALLDMEQGIWAVERLTPTGIDPAILPPIRSAVDNAGSLLPDIARQFGLPAKAMVIVGAGDMISLLAAAPPKTGRMTCSLGSSCMVASPLKNDQSFQDAQSRLYKIYVPPYHLINGVLSTSGAALTWAWKSLFDEGTPLENILIAVEKLAPGAERLLFLPFLAGERSPYWNDSLRGGFYGLTLAHNRAHMMRAVMEGVAYSLRQLIEISEELGVEISEIALSGGGAGTRGWPQIIADVCQLPVVIYSEQETVTRPLYAYCTQALEPAISFDKA
ncbi:MAG: xylulokinase, partial [Candidatus Promineifilaceae bacterium]